MAAVTFDTLRSLAFGSISGTYAALGSPASHNWRIVKVTNNTDGDMIVSTSSSNASGNIFVPAFGFTLYDFSTNNNPQIPTDVLVVSKGTQFYVKQSSAPTSGSVYLEAVYAGGQ